MCVLTYLFLPLFNIHVFDVIQLYVSSDCKFIVYDTDVTRDLLILLYEPTMNFVVDWTLGEIRALPYYQR